MCACVHVRVHVCVRAWFVCVRACASASVYPFMRVHVCVCFCMPAYVLHLCECVSIDSVSLTPVHASCTSVHSCPNSCHRYI